jgi:Fe2+ or Zn2+ uptake regulation protein
MGHTRRKEHNTMAAGSRGTFRNTTQRSVILQVVERADAHLTAAEIYERVRREYPSIAYGTVYRTLHLLAEHALIQELTFADQASRFDKRTDRHDHVHCSVCGAIEDVDVPVALLAQHVASDRTGYEISSHHTVFVGTCPDCQARQDATGATGTRANAGR